MNADSSESKCSTVYFHSQCQSCFAIHGHQYGIHPDFQFYPVNLNIKTESTSRNMYLPSSLFISVQGCKRCLTLNPNFLRATWGQFLQCVHIENPTYIAISYVQGFVHLLKKKLCSRSVGNLLTILHHFMLMSVLKMCPSSFLSAYERVNYS